MKPCSLPCLFALLTPWLACAQTTIFDDTFGNSTMNDSSPASPTATSANYDIASGKNATSSSISAGDLKIAMASTSGSLVEAQALFTTTPVTLASTGDYIEFTATFKDTANIMLGGTQGALWTGLFNSGGSSPLTGLNNGGLNTASGSALATGGTANWQGYAAALTGGSGANTIATRPQQNGPGTASINQELLGNGIVSAASYDNPAGAKINSSSSTFGGLTTGSTYTIDLKITYTSGTTPSLSLDYDLYSGSSATGTAIDAEEATAIGTNILTTTFDGFSLGERYSSSTAAASSMDVSQILVTDQIAAVPEPGTFGLVVIGALTWACRRKMPIGK